MTGTDGPLRITTSTSGLLLSGEIDAHAVISLATYLDPLPGTSGDVVIDLSGVMFVDSSGLRVLVEAHQRAEAEGRRLVLSGSTRPVLRLLEITGLMDYLHVDGVAADDGTTANAETTDG